MSSVELPVLDGTEPPRPPFTVLVRHGYLGFIGRFAVEGEECPRWGSTVVVRTRRGTELARVLAEPCSLAGRCRMIEPERMEQYVRASGGRDYPFSTEGRVLRTATAEDLARQARLEAAKAEHLAYCRRLIQQLELPMRLIDVEPLLGAEMYTFYFAAEHRVDFRALVRQLAARLRARVQMHQVGSRDEARLVADFETCGQECCCRKFLKVLRPVNMGAAKLQKATLDPSKISGRCGRLKCCLRYEEVAYDELRRRLPKVGSRVRTAEGEGVVEETAILTQIVKVRLADDRVVAVANEELLGRQTDGTRTPAAAPDARGAGYEETQAPEPAEEDDAPPPRREEDDADTLSPRAARAEDDADTRRPRAARADKQPPAVERQRPQPPRGEGGQRATRPPEGGGGSENRRRRDRSRGR